MSEANNSFLRQVAQYLIDNHAATLSDYTIVFPNRRAGLFFRKYLAECSPKPIFAPKCIDLSKLFAQISELTLADEIRLIYELHKSFQKCHKPNNNEGNTLEKFYFRGETLLADFNEIDRQLINARLIFSNAGDLKEIENRFPSIDEEQANAIKQFWGKDNNGKTLFNNDKPINQDFSSLWDDMFAIYTDFRQNLISQKIAYGGLMQRHSVENLLDTNNLPDEKYVFIGFNALTKCEEKLFHLLKDSNKALFFWDVDDYYIKDHQQEAGYFLRQNVENFPTPLSINNNNLSQRTEKIQVYAIPSETAQAKKVAQILSEIKDQSDLLRTAIVLPNENLLIPLLHSLPKEIKDLNITMGYPVSYSPAYTLFERLTALQTSNSEQFPHNLVTALLQHPHLQAIAQKPANDLISTIITENKIHINEDLIPKTELFQLLFRRTTNANEFINYLLEIYSTFIYHLSPSQDDSKEESTNSLSTNASLEIEHLKTIKQKLQTIKNILCTEGAEIIDFKDIKTFSLLVRKTLLSLKTPFSGEPLKGLQVMGTLETRALDFDNVIMLSLNEGVFPSANMPQSFIPYTLRHGFKLATNEKQDSVAAYHFYRLLQRAKNVHLIYNSTASDSGEPSRFIQQLKYEKFDTEQAVIEEHTLNFSFKPSGQLANEPIERDEETRTELAKFTTQNEDKRKLSPSAINTFLACQKQFYFRYIKGLKEPKELTEEVDSAIFGNILHQTMEKLYKKKGPHLSKDTIESIQKDETLISDTILKAFDKYYFHKGEPLSVDDLHGQNRIIFEVIKKLIDQILDLDKQCAPLTIIGTEKEIDHIFPIEDKDGTTLNINLYGKIDRIDRLKDGKTYRIVDYKTGSVKLEFELENVFELDNKGELSSAYKAINQALTYSYLYSKQNPGLSPIAPALYVTRAMNDKDFSPYLILKDNKAHSNLDDFSFIRNDFEPKLKQILTDIFVSDKPFMPAKSDKACQYCPFAAICY